MGIPIEDDLFKEFPDDVKNAWGKFHAWWEEEGEKSYANMPEDVRKAFDLMKEAPIPGMIGRTLADSCYVRGVERLLK